MSKLGGKHKRGARGSLEEELTTPKRTNMAESCVDESVAVEAPNALYLGVKTCETHEWRKTKKTKHCKQ